MSLDLYIISEKSRINKPIAFILENVGITDINDPNSNITYYKEYTEIWSGNITHNLTRMAERIGIGDETLYSLLWHPQEILTLEYIEKIQIAMNILINNRKELEKFNPPNGWGNYDTLHKFLTSYLNVLLVLKNDIIDGEVFKLRASI